MPDQKIIECIVKDIQGKANAAEKAILQEWLDADPTNRTIYERIRQTRHLLEGAVVHRKALGRSKQIRAKVLKNVARELKRKPKLLIMRRQWAAAAAVLLLIGGGWWWMNTRNQRTNAPQVIREALQPGRNKATLILADKKELALTDVATGEIARQGKTQVTKTDSGEIAYRNEDQKTEAKQETAYNTILTPRGGQYRLKLADGTMVYLNAQSSLQFPVNFDAKERRVSLKGEAYFDVAPDAKRPFKIQLETEEITVLGTRFDVQNYADDTQGSVTLLEGKIEVANKKTQAILQPEEKAKWDRQGEISKEKDETPESSIAWTRGLFRFRNTPLSEVMRQLSRWYDVDVEFQGAAPEVPITASINRNTNAWEVFEALKDIAGLNYKVEGKKIIILH